MVAILEKLKSKLASDQESALDAFLTLARQIASGDEPSAATVRDVLRAADQEIDDLERIVSLIQQRPGLRAEVQAGEQVEAEIAAARGEIPAIDAALEAAKQTHALAHAAVSNRVAIAQQKSQAAREARAKLIDPRFCPDSRLADKLASVRDRIAGIEGELRGLTEASFDQEQRKPEIVARLDAARNQEQRLIDEIFKV